MKRFYLLFATMLTSVNVCAQEDVGANYFNLVPQVVSPQLEAMMRFDQMQVAMGSGKIDLTLPVINFSDPDFDFPITISYDSGGFIPSLSDNYVGRNWSLNVGGAIYRTVNGIADESQHLEMPTNYDVRGFLYAAKDQSLWMSNEDLRYGFLTNPDAYTDRKVNHSSFRLIKGTNIEASPDIFTFSFGKHSGKFMITYDGTVKVLSNSGGKYKVDISDFNVQSEAFSSGVNNATIKITTDDGYVYSFGGSYDAMEYMAHGWDSRSAPEAFGLGRKQNQVNAFYLSKIKAPNGREMTINYLQVGMNYHKSPVSAIYSNDVDLGVNYSFAGKPFASWNFLLGVGNTENMETNIAITKNTYSINKMALVSSIVVDDKRAEFYFSPRSQASFETANSYYRFASMCGAQLNSVAMYDKDDKVIERCDLTYQYHSNRMFLKQIKHSKLGAYSFNYNLGFIPGIYERNIDHWGFWRGDVPHLRDIPKINVGDYTLFRNTYSIVSDDRDAIGEQCDITMLNEVVSPTGGKVEFEYEPNDCLFKVKNGYDGVCWESNISGENEFVGGARIKSVKHYDKIDNRYELVKHNQYKYVSAGSLKSSGTAEYMPHYVLFNHQLARYTPPSYSSLALVNSEGFNSPGYNTNHISYERVTEYQVESMKNIQDSSLSISIVPLDGTRVKRLNCSVGNFGSMNESIFPHHDRGVLANIERQYAKWTIKGSSASANIVGRVTIRGGDNVSREYVFNANNQTPVVFNPVAELGNGEYSVTLQADPGAYLSFTTEYPHTGAVQIFGPYRQVDFIGYRANYNDYSYSNPFFILDSMPVSLPFHTYQQMLDCQADPSSVCKLDPTKKHSTRISLFASDYDLSFYQMFFADYIRPLDRGKISQEYYFDSNNKQTRFIQYIYGDKGRGNVVSYIKHQAFSDVLKVSAIGHFVRMPFFSNHLISKTTTDYDGSGNSMIVGQEEYDYDQDGYLKGKSVLNSKGETVKTTYVNANDVSSELFRDKNMLSTIVEESNHVVKGDASTELMRIKRYFKSIVNSQDATMPAIDYVVQELNGAMPQTRVICNNYDKYGNPVYVVNDGSKHTVYLWSYGGKYMVAKIENATYDQVKVALGGVNPESLSQQSAPVVTQLNGLRSNLLLAQVTTYTYYPLIGMASQTDPSGKIVNYVYDSANRLKEVSTIGESGVKEVLVKNQYNIVNK